MFRTTVPDIHMMSDDTALNQEVNEITTFFFSDLVGLHVS